MQHSVYKAELERAKEKTAAAKAKLMKRKRSSTAEPGMGNVDQFYGNETDECKRISRSQ